jgi:dethiobiotin synthetase
MNAAKSKDALDLVNPYRFRKPLAPSVAAYLEGKKIDFPKITSAFRTLSRKHEFMIVEGAGGIMVPLSSGCTYRDLAYAMGLPVVIVARPGLGTINHTLLTVSALRAKRIEIAGIIINYADKQPKGLAEATGPSVIEEMSKLPILGIVHHKDRNLNGVVDQVLSLPGRRARK